MGLVVQNVVGFDTHLIILQVIFRSNSGSFGHVSAAQFMSSTDLVRRVSKPEKEFSSRCDDLLIQLHELDIPGVQETKLVDHVASIARCFAASVEALRDDAAAWKSRAQSSEAALQKKTTEIEQLKQKLADANRECDFKLTKLRLELARNMAALRRQAETHEQQLQQAQSQRDEWEHSLQAAADASVEEQVRAHVESLKAQHAAALQALEFEFECEARKRSAAHNSALHAAQAELRRVQRKYHELEDGSTAHSSSGLPAQLADAARQLASERQAREAAEAEVRKLRAEIASIREANKLQQLRFDAQACWDDLTDHAAPPPGATAPPPAMSAVLGPCIPPVRAVSPVEGSRVCEAGTMAPVPPPQLGSEPAGSRATPPPTVAASQRRRGSSGSSESLDSLSSNDDTS